MCDITGDIMCKWVKTLLPVIHISGHHLATRPTFYNNSSYEDISDQLLTVDSLTNNSMLNQVG